VGVAVTSAGVNWNVQSPSTSVIGWPGVVGWKRSRAHVTRTGSVAGEV
jgi:hypothetical protein